MAKFMSLILAILVTFFAFSVAAQQKCEGPPELCAQIVQLKADLDNQKKLSSEAQVSKVADDKQVAALQEQQKSQESRTVKFIGAMSTVAIVLKILLSLLTTWKDTLFSSDKGKASIRIAILVVTLGIFLTTNMGFGIPWWQALILAAGGPLSMFLHEMMKLIPVIRGQKKLAPDPVPAPDPPQDVAPPAS